MFLLKRKDYTCHDVRENADADRENKFFQSVRMTAMPSERSPHWKAYAALGLGVLTLGFSAIFTRAANAPASVVSFYRMAIGTLVLLIPFASRFKRKRTLASRGLMLAVLAGIFFALDLAAWSTGINYSGATIPTLMGNMAPVCVGLGAWLIFKEKLNSKFWLGLTISLLGAMLVIGLDSSGNLQFNAGALFGLLAAVFYGGYLLIAQKGRAQLDALSFFWIATLSSAASLLLLAVVLNDPLTGYPISTYLNFFGLGVLVQAIGWLAINYAQGFLPASLVSPTLLIQPLLTAILAGPLLGETFSAVEMLGGVAVLGGIVIVYRSRQVTKVVGETI